MNQEVIPGTSINIITDKVSFHKLTVTPFVAQWLLNRSAGNKVRAEKDGINKSHLQTVRGIIARGEWQAAQTGAIDSNGVLIDGHHRLHAIVLECATLPMWFKIGCEPREVLAVDQGKVRTSADQLQLDKREAEVLRLAAAILHGSKKPSPIQLKQIMDSSKLLDYHRLLLNACPSCRKYITIVPMRLAACVKMYAGSSSSYVTTQYRALALADYDLMSKSAKAFTRQVSNGLIRPGHTYDVLARGLIVFDETKQHVSKIQIDDPTQAAVIARGHLNRMIAGL